MIQEASRSQTKKQLQVKFIDVITSFASLYTNVIKLIMLRSYLQRSQDKS